MALDNDKEAQVFLKLTELKFQVDRLVSDAESEKEFRKSRNNEIERRLRSLEDWRNELHGRIVVTLVVGGAIWTVLVGLMFWLLNKK